MCVCSAGLASRNTADPHPLNMAADAWHTHPQPGAGCGEQLTCGSSSIWRSARFWVEVSSGGPDWLEVKTRRADHWYRSVDSSRQGPSWQSVRRRQPAGLWSQPSHGHPEPQLRGHSCQIPAGQEIEGSASWEQNQVSTITSSTVFFFLIYCT